MNASYQKPAEHEGTIGQWSGGWEGRGLLVMQMEKKYSFAMSYQIISFKLAFFLTQLVELEDATAIFFPGPETFYERKSTSEAERIKL